MASAFPNLFFSQSLPRPNSGFRQPSIISAATIGQNTRPDPPSTAPDPMPRISAYIIAFNEAAKVGDAIRSVQWADEVVVADSHSTDDTAGIAQALGARVVQIPFQGFGALRNVAVAACTHDWVFSLDAD